MINKKNQGFFNLLKFKIMKNKIAKSEMEYLAKMLLWAITISILAIGVGYLVYSVAWR